MTVSNPPLVDVIAGVLLNHRAIVTERTYATCNCDATSRNTDQHAAHQARAVLDALAEAGAVQFGVKGEGRVKEYGRDRRRAQLAARERGATFVSRITTPWMAVEG